MLNDNFVGTIAGLALPVELLIFERYRRRHLKLEKDILVDTLLPKVE